MNHLEDRALRRVAVVSLVAAPLLGLASTVLQPPFVSSYAQRLADVEAAGVAPWLSNTLFITMQVPMLVAFVAIAAVVRVGSPRLSVLGAGLAVLATMGECVMGGMSMVYLRMAHDTDNRAIHASLWEQAESSPVMAFAVVGFLGTVVTHLLLSAGLFRSRSVPRWVPVLIWAYLVLEFGGSNLSAFSSYAASVCLLVAFGAVAVHVQRAAVFEDGAESDSCASSSPVPRASSARL